MRIGEVKKELLDNVSGHSKDSFAQERAAQSTMIDEISDAVASGTKLRDADVSVNEKMGTVSGTSGAGGQMTVTFKTPFTKAVILILANGINVDVYPVSVNTTSFIIKRVDGAVGQPTTICYIARGY